MSKGGGSSVPANTTSQTTNQVILPDWVNTMAQSNVATAQNLAQTPYSPYTGQTVAPINATQQAAINAAAGTIGSTAPTYNAAIGNVTNLPQTTQSLMNPYLSDVEGAATKAIQQQGAISGQALASGAVGQGAFGGTRYGIEQALNNSQTQYNIGQTVAGIENTGWNQATNAALNQATTMGNLAGAGQTSALQADQAALSAGGAEQTQQQAQDAAALQQWQQQQNWPYQQLQVLQSALQGTPYGTTTTSTQPYAQNATANMFGNIAASIGLGNSAYQLGSGIYGKLFGSGAGSAASAAGSASTDLFAGNTMDAALAGSGTSAATTAAADATAAAGSDLFAGSTLDAALAFA